mgnify:FL=1
MDEVDTKQLLEHLTELELSAQDLLEERQSVINLDRKRNQTREARTALRKVINNKSPLDGNKTWVCYGNTFIKMKNDSVVKMLDDSHKKLDDDIKSTRDGLRTKLNKVREIEGKSHAAGFNLQALSKDEQAALNKLL